jgi:hypothetical protein
LNPTSFANRHSKRSSVVSRKKKKTLTRTASFATVTEAAVAMTAVIAITAVAVANDEGAAVLAAPQSLMLMKQIDARQWPTASDPTARQVAFHLRVTVATTATEIVIAIVSAIVAILIDVPETATDARMSASVCTALVGTRVVAAMSLTMAVMLVVQPVTADVDVKATRKA